jgi:hypothetical protein
MVGMVIELAILVAILAGLWKTFEKMGKPGWNGIVPIYNIILILEVVGKPIWWIILFLIPVVNVVVAILVMIPFAAKFGKSPAFGVGLALLSFIFFPILGFGDAQYSGATPTGPAIPTQS